MTYFRPLVQSGAIRPDGAMPLAGGNLWFTHLEMLERDGDPVIVTADKLPPQVSDRLTAPRESICGLDMSRPQVMGILNVTPDSFSDGGQHNGTDLAVARGLQMQSEGAAMIDIGGESTRPAADFIPGETEIDRISPVITQLAQRASVPLSVDTRKAEVAQAALIAGVRLINDVSGLVYDDRMAGLAGAVQAPVCVMHSQGTPDVMQHNPRYHDVLLDVYDFLEAQVALLEQAGLPRAKVMIDPGVGFGKTQAHNLMLLQGLSLFHGIGCPILLGVSRKRFIGDIGGNAGDGMNAAAEPAAVHDRLGGSIAVGLAGVAQGAQILRVHDVAQTVQALRLWHVAH
jgi:dihydropteroate synthase